MGWSAEGGTAGSVDAITGDQLDTVETYGANGAAAGPDGTVYVAATSVGSPHRVVAVRPGGSEQAFDVGGAELDSGILVVGDDEVWVTTRDRRILRLATADGALLGECPTGEDYQLVVASSGAVAARVDGELAVNSDAGQRLATLSGVATVDASSGGFAGVQPSDSGSGGVVVEYTAPDFAQGRTGAEEVALPERIDVGHGAVALGFEHAVTLVDPETLAPRCTSRLPTTTSA